MAASKDKTLAAEIIDQEEKEIAAKLCHLRKQLGIEQEQLSLATGISEQDLDVYERGLEAIPASALAIISAVVNIDIDYFFSNDEWSLVDLFL